MVTLSKFYLHRATDTGPGTLPGSSALGGTPTVTATGAATNRWLDGTISGVAQTSTTTTTDGTANAQTAWFTRHLSPPIAAQTISAQTITYSGAADEANAGSNFNPTIFLGVWDPVGNALRGTLLAVGAITVLEPGTTQTAGAASATSTQVVASAGDLIVCEVWRKSVAPGATTARTNIVFWDGTTEASTTNEASFISFTNAITLQAIAPAPTTLALTLTMATPTVTATNNITSLPTSLALTFTGATPAVTTTANVASQPTALSMTLTGATPSVLAPALSVPTALAMILTGATPTVKTPVVIVPSSFATTLTGAVPAVMTPVSSSPTALALAWTGAVPSVSAPAVSQPTALGLTWTGAVPTVTVTTGSSVTVLPSALSMSLSMATPVVTRTDNILVTPSVVAFNLSFSTPAVTTTSKVAVEPTPLRISFTGDAPYTPSVVGGARHAIFIATPVEEDDPAERMAAAEAEDTRLHDAIRAALLAYRSRKARTEEWLLGLVGEIDR